MGSLRNFLGLKMNERQKRLRENFIAKFTSVKESIMSKGWKPVQTILNSIGTWYATAIKCLERLPLKWLFLIGIVSFVISILSSIVGLITDPT
ncbi:MAG: hypothetical protein ACRC0G_03985, partial [Fusobacteriaceae bacterium]